MGFSETHADLLEENEYILEKCRDLLGDNSELLEKNVKNAKRKILADLVISLRTCINKNSEYLKNTLHDQRRTPQKPRKSFLSDKNFDELQYMTKLGLATSLRSLVFNNRSSWNLDIITCNTKYGHSDTTKYGRRNTWTGSYSNQTEIRTSSPHKDSIVILGFKSKSRDRVLEYLSLINISRNHIVQCVELCDVTPRDITSHLSLCDVSSEESEVCEKSEIFEKPKTSQPSGIPGASALLDEETQIKFQNTLTSTSELKEQIEPKNSPALPDCTASYHITDSTASYRIKLSSASLTVKALRSSQFLRRYCKELSKVYVTPDRTQEEKRRHQELVQEIRERVQGDNR